MGQTGMGSQAFSALLASAMKAKRLDYRTLSSLVGVSHAYLWQLANPEKQPVGKPLKRPSRPLALKLAQTLELAPEDVLRAAGYGDGEAPEALPGITHYAAFKPDAPEHFRRGLEETRKGNPERGIVLLKQAVGQEGVSFVRAHMGLGVAYYQARQYDAAIDEFTKVIATIEASGEPSATLEGIALSDALYNRGLALQDSDRHRKAKKDFERAIVLTGEHPDRYYAALCFSHLATGHFQRVIQVAQDFLDEQIDSPSYTTAALDVRLYQAYALARQGQFESAVALLSAIELLLPSYWYTPYTAAAVYSLYGKVLEDRLARSHGKSRVRRQDDRRRVLSQGLRHCRRALALNPHSRGSFMAERQGDFAYFASLPEFTTVFQAEGEV